MLSCTLWAQNEISLVVSGEGKNKEEATFKALLNAIEQTYSTFVSANTTMLNNPTVADEIISLAPGNIKKYEYISENKKINGNTSVTLLATVSIDKLVSFAENKGVKAELKGSLLAMNIKKMQFDKQAEEQAVEYLCQQLETMLPTLFEYNIKLKEPKLSDGKTKVDFEVFASMNENMIYFCNQLINTLKYLSLSKVDIDNYEKINNEIYYLDLEQLIRYHYTQSCINLINKHDFIVTSFDCYTDSYKNKITPWFALSFLWSPLSVWTETEINNECDMISRRISDLSQDILDIGLQVDHKGYNKQECFKTLNDKIKNPKKNSTKPDQIIEYNFSYWLQGPLLFHLRSKKSINSIKSLFHKWKEQLYAVEIDDGLQTHTPHIDIRPRSRFFEDSLYNHYSKWFKNYPLFENDKPTYYVFWKRKDGEDLFDLSNLSKDIDIIYGSLLYTLDDLSKISNVTVNPIVPKEIAEYNRQISNLTKYNDTLQQFVNEYNSVLKQYPYDYNSNSISYSFSTDLLGREDILSDSLQVLIEMISKKKTQLQERYQKDSLEFWQFNEILQEKIKEANIHFLKYPYNLQKRTLKDSLSISLFGITEELNKELDRKVTALPKMQEQAEKEVYVETKKNNPQIFVEIFFAQDPLQKQLAEKEYVECRCKYDERLAFYMAFIDHTLLDCNCRETEYKAISYLYHSREEFDQSYSQEESEYNQEVKDRKTMMEDKKVIDEILYNNKKWNFKKASSSSKEELKSIVERINKHKGKYYYSDIIDLIFTLDSKLAKEWEKNGSYFKSKVEMYENWIGDDYNKVLKSKK